MRSTYRSGSRRIIRAIVILAASLTAGALGCGPDFPNRYFDAPDAMLLAGPRAVLVDELTRITAPLEITHKAAPTSDDDRRAIDVGELRTALGETGIPGTRAEAIVATFARIRAAVDNVSPDAREGESGWRIPEDVPQEFAGYLGGAAAWHRGDVAGARAVWMSVLDLPLARRRHRTVWAEFMIGRTWEREMDRATGAAAAAAAVQARQWFRRTQADIDAGFPDTLGLFVASLGREAQVAYRTGDHGSAFQLYARQFAAGDRSAISSLMGVANAALAATDDDLSALAADPIARDIITAGFLARRIDPYTKDVLSRWTTALQKAEVVAMGTADRLAWLAYREGRFDLAAEWMDLAPADAPYAAWVRAKLALRAGNLGLAESCLMQVSAEGALPVAQRRLALAELGRTRLARDDFAGALTAWLDGDHWEDAAYVAEQVMTLDELRSYVDANCPPESRELGPQDPMDVRTQLRFLLGRRLVRAARTDQAAAYYPVWLHDSLSNYATATRIGFDVSRPAEERAAAFWNAARIMRQQGLKLWATELDPDWAIWGAIYARGVAFTDRRARTAEFGPTLEEVARHDQHPASTKRLSYRYRAADLAWWAASLMPNDSADTARILMEAGGWLKDRDPRAAERFYQAMAIRCGNTSLGRAAAQIHWFPVSAGEDTPAIRSAPP